MIVLGLYISDKNSDLCRHGRHKVILLFDQFMLLHVLFQSDPIETSLHSLKL